jgi:hypothetical protein
MRGLPRTTVVLLFVAGGVSLLLTLSAFVVQVPLRQGAHTLIRTASGANAEVPVAHQTYYQRYGPSELLLLGLGLVLVAAVGVALRLGGTRATKRLAWGLSIASLVLGVAGFVTIAPSLLLVGVLLVLSCSTGTRARGVGAGRRAERAGIRTAGAL